MSISDTRGQNVWTHGDTGMTPAVNAKTSLLAPMGILRRASSTCSRSVTGVTNVSDLGRS
jgi:hypothetical protein